MENIEKDCCICGSKVTLFKVQEKWICNHCIQIGDEERMSLWKDSIEKLFMEYSDACNRVLSSDEPEDVYKARVFGSKIQSLLQFVGLPKKHVILLPIRKVNLILKKMEEADMLLDEIEEMNEGNNVNAELVTLLSKEHKKLSEQLTEVLPNLLNDLYAQDVKTFINEKLKSYIQPLIKEDSIRYYEERFNALVEEYGQSAEAKGKTSRSTIKILNKIRKEAKAISYIYSFYNEFFGEQYQDKETYYNDIHRQIIKVDDMKDWLNQLKVYKKKIHAPKKEKNAVKDKIKGKMEFFIENVELHSIPVKES